MKMDNTPEIILGFMHDLRQHNTREWMHANHDRYVMAMACRDEYAAALIEAVASVDPAASLLSVRECVYRLARDIRFSTDKTPYKTHVGIFINPPEGKKSLRSGYYFHLEPGASFVCGGNIGLPGPLLAQVRKSIADNIEEYRGIVEDEDFRRMFPILGDNPVKTAPKGFSRDWEFINYVRPRNFIVSSAPDDSLFTRADSLEALRPYIEKMRLYNDFINYTVDTFREA